MKVRALYSLIMLAFTGGCATQIEKSAWEIRPTIGVRHGMRSADAHYQLGRYYQGQNRLREAERAFQQALGEDDRHIGALNALGALYASRGDLDKALATFRHVETLTTDQAYLHNNLGYALMMQGKNEEALEQLKRAVTLDPGYERAWINLGELARTRGDAQLAREVERRLPLTTIVPLAQGPALEPANRAAVPGTESVPKLTMTTSLAAAPTELRAPANAAHAAAAPAQGKPTPPAGGAAQSSVAAADLNAVRMIVAKWPDANPAVRLSPIRTLELDVAPERKLDLVSRPMRLEVSNANGIRRFATRLGIMLNAVGVPVSRITNHSSFSVEATVIEYKPGFEAAAADLNERLNLKAKLVERRLGGASSDIKVVLGRDLARRTAHLS